MAKDGEAVRRARRSQNLWLEEQNGEEAALMEQLVRQLLEELTLGKLDICTADAGARENGGSRSSFPG